MDTHDRNLPSNRPNGSPASLSVRVPATQAQIMARVTALSLHYAQQPMTDQERRIWLLTFCEDLADKTDAEIAEGCRNYRRNPENKFRPTPGQLRDACEPKYTGGYHRSYESLPPPLEPLPIEERQRMIGNMRAAFPRVFQSPEERAKEEHREEVLKRPPMKLPESSAELSELEKSLAEERRATLQRRLESGGPN